MQQGELVASRFEIEDLAGEGGMATVYRARDRMTGQSVALKLLRDAGPADRLRFEREGQVLSELHHPCVVRYIAHGFTKAGEPYLAMEWLEGETLDERLARAGLSIEESLRVGRLVAEALAAAHSRGVVHRDIKPSNLFLVNQQIEQIKVLDFGVARFGRTLSSMTRTGVLVGTPGYMAPEQASGSREVDARADIFSLGCVLFECLTGRPAFVGEHVIAVLAKIVFEDAPRVSELRDDIPESLDDLVARMVSKDPAGRPSDAARVATEITAMDVRVRSPRQAVDSTPGPALGPAELRIASVILAGIQPASSAVEAGSEGAPSSAFDRLRTAVAPFSARLERLADGSPAAALSGKGSATDQATQAARCALAMRSILPDVPIVLATGRGVLEGRLPVGEVIDRAVGLLRAHSDARPPSSGLRRPRPIYLDEVTAGLLDTRFDVVGDEGMPELSGEHESVDEAMRTLLGKPTPCVGRERKLAVLGGLFDECVAEPMARAVLVTGVAGVGKSRVRSEFLRSLRRRAEPIDVWIARGDPIRIGSPLGMLAQLLRHCSSVLDGEPLAERRKKLRARVSSTVAEDDIQRVTEFLGELIGTPFPEDSSVQLRAARQDAMLMGDQMRRAWEDFISSECASHPVLIVLEDLHWGDRPSVQFIDAALRRAKEQPLFVLALARPDVHDMFPKLWADRDLQSIHLEELSRKASERLVRQVLGESFSPEVVERVVGQASGNAFYLEELIRAVAEGSVDSLPGTVLAMVQARLEALDPEARRVMRAGSIFGEAFWRGGVRSLLGTTEPMVELQGWLRLLVERELIARRGEGKFPGEQEYTFRHALVREAVYGTLTDGDRALGHRLAGQWLEAMGEPDAMALAEHFERGGELEHAAEFYHRAAQQALEANDLDAVIERAERAIQCGAKGTTRGALRLLQSEAHSWRGELAEAEQRGLEAMRMLPREDALWFSAASEVAAGMLSRGDHERLVTVVEELARPVSADQAFAPQLVVMAQVARQLLRAGLQQAAEPLYDKLAALTAHTKNDPTVAGHLHVAFAVRALMAGDPAAGCAVFEASAASFELAGDVRNSVLRRMSAAITRMHFGWDAEAESGLREVLKLARRVGLDRVVEMAKHNLGRALAHQGALEEAREMEEQAISAFRSQGDQRFEGMSRIYLAGILLKMRDLDDAELEARQAAELCERIPTLRCEALAVLCQVRLARGRVREAREAADEAMQLLEQLGGVEENESLVRVAYAEALFASGDIHARAAIASAREWLMARASKIDDMVWRRRFLEDIAENARTLELARALLGTDVDYGLH